MDINTSTAGLSLLLAGLLLSGCTAEASSSTSGAAKPGDCAKLAEIPPDVSAATVALVVDNTASGVRGPAPTAVVEALTKAQERGDQLAIVPVDGAGKAGRISRTVALDPYPGKEAETAKNARAIALQCVGEWMREAAARPTAPALMGRVTDAMRVLFGNVEQQRRIPFNRERSKPGYGELVGDGITNAEKSVLIQVSQTLAGYDHRRANRLRRFQHKLVTAAQNNLLAWDGLLGSQEDPRWTGHWGSDTAERSVPPPETPIETKRVRPFLAATPPVDPDADHQADAHTHGQEADPGHPRAGTHRLLRPGDPRDRPVQLDGRLHRGPRQRAATARRLEQPQPQEARPDRGRRLRRRGGCAPGADQREEADRHRPGGVTGRWLSLQADS